MKILLILSIILFSSYCYIYEGVVTGASTGRCDLAPYNAPVDNDETSYLFCFQDPSDANNTGIVICYSLDKDINDYTVWNVQPCEGGVKVCRDKGCPDRDKACCLPIGGSGTGAVTQVIAVIVGILAACFGIAAVAFITALCLFCGISFNKNKPTKILWDDNEDFSGIEVSPLYDEIADQTVELTSVETDVHTSPVVQQVIVNTEKKTEVKQKQNVEIVKSTANPRPNSVGKYYNFGEIRNVFKDKAVVGSHSKAQPLPPGSGHSKPQPPSPE